MEKKKRIYILGLIILQALSGGSGVLYALLLRGVVDKGASHDKEGFWYYVLLLVLLVLGQIIIRAAIRWLSELSRSTFENYLKTRLMHNLLHRDFEKVNALHSGEWLNRLTNDTVVVANAWVEILPGLIGMVVKMISAVIMLIVLDSRFAMIILPFGALLILLTYAFRRVLKKLHKKVQESDGRLRIFLQERIGSMSIIRSFAAEERTEAEAAHKMEDHKAARMKRNRFSNVCNTGFGLAMNGMYLFGICYCGYGILTGTISFGTLTAVTQLIAQIQTPFAGITSYLPRYFAMIASKERLSEAESFAMDVENSESISGIKKYYDENMSAFGLEKVSYTYYPAAEKIKDLSKDAMPQVLSDYSIEVKKGEYFAFTGHSGCGKSTVLKLLMGLYRPDAGSAYILDRTGKKEETTSVRGRLFAYVPQGNMLMSGTIREIVTFADEKSAGDEARIKRALSIACADEFVAELEEGIDTLLGERGTGLSEGQMQRIAIARAIFSESPVLLLDEATSALDEQTERRLLENLRNMTDVTVVIVTHRKAALEICDRVICEAD